MIPADIHKKEVTAGGIRLFVERDSREIGRVYLYILKNDLHGKPFGLIEDLFVVEAERGKGIGTSLLSAATEEAKNAGCYKLIFTSRYSNDRAHKLYIRSGFQDVGKEFRMNFE